MKRIINLLKRNVSDPEIPLGDMSIWEVDDNGNPNKPIYIETETIATQSNVFRKDYRKLLLTIASTTTGCQIPACRKMFKLFVAKYDIYGFIQNVKNDVSRERQFAENVCGYIDNLIEQKEAKYGYMC